MRTASIITAAVVISVILVGPRLPWPIGENSQSAYQPELLEVSEELTATLKWVHYACGEDACPDFQVLSVADEAHRKYAGRHTTAWGYDFWREDESLPEQERSYSAYQVLSEKKFICHGRFRRYSVPPDYPCDLDCKKDLLSFEAVQCEPSDMTPEDELLQEAIFQRND